MNRNLRPVPYPYRSQRRRDRIEQALRYGWAPSYREAVAQVIEMNERARNTPLRGERCGAHARSTGNPCRAGALANGRCKSHGGKSTGPRTPEGKVRVTANLPRTGHPSGDL